MFVYVMKEREKKITHRGMVYMILEFENSHDLHVQASDLRETKGTSLSLQFSETGEQMA